MHGRPLTPEAYDASRWIVEPFRLFDCCMENDGAAALVLVSAERARDLRHPPAYLLGVAQGSEYRNAARGHNAPTYASSSFTTVAPHLWEMAGLGPKDVDVVQSYENFTGGVLMSLVEHGFFAPEEANDFLTPENLIAPGGRLPLNTSGGNLAECYMHGLELQIEAVRQLRGESTSQVPGARVVDGDLGPDGDAGLEHDPRHGGDAVSAARRICRPACRARWPRATGSTGRTGRARARGELLVQRCRACGDFQWGPEWICHRCLVVRPRWRGGGPARPHLQLGARRGIRCTRRSRTTAPTSSCWSSCPTRATSA